MSEKECQCEVINSASVGYEPSPECFGCEEDQETSMMEFAEKQLETLASVYDMMLEDKIAAKRYGTKKEQKETEIDALIAWGRFEVMKSFIADFKKIQG